MSEKEPEFQSHPRDVQLARLRKEARIIQTIIEANSGVIHSFDTVMSVISIAFQLGQLGEVWNEFIPEETLGEIGYEAGQGEYPPKMKATLGKRLAQEFSRSEDGSMSTESLRTVAAIETTLGDLSRKQN